MKHKLSRCTLACLLAASAASAGAAVVQSTGTGSAVLQVTNSVNFTANNSMLSNYVEDGMRLASTGSTNNNGCGYAGCSYHVGFYPGFSGNYMYTVGQNAYVSMRMADNSDFFAIEFAAGSGVSSSSIFGYWQTFNNAAMTGAGNFTTAGVQVIGLADSAGFDEVRYFAFGGANLQSGYSGAAVDNIRVGGSTLSSASTVPEPGSLALVTAAMLGGVVVRRRRTA